VVKVTVYTNPMGFVAVSVEGNNFDSPAKVAKAYKRAKEEASNANNRQKSTG